MSSKPTENNGQKRTKRTSISSLELVKMLDTQIARAGTIVYAILPSAGKEEKREAERAMKAIENIRKEIHGAIRKAGPVIDNRKQLNALCEASDKIVLDFKRSWDSKSRDLTQKIQRLFSEAKIGIANDYSLPETSDEPTFQSHEPQPEPETATEPEEDETFDDSDIEDASPENDYKEALKRMGVSPDQAPAKVAEWVYGLASFISGDYFKRLGADPTLRFTHKVSRTQISEMVGMFKKLRNLIQDGLSKTTAPRPLTYPIVKSCILDALKKHPEGKRSLDDRAHTLFSEFILSMIQYYLDSDELFKSIDAIKEWEIWAKQLNEKSVTEVLLADKLEAATKSKNEAERLQYSPLENEEQATIWRITREGNPNIIPNVTKSLVHSLNKDFHGDLSLRTAETITHYLNDQQKKKDESEKSEEANAKAKAEEEVKRAEEFRLRTATEQRALQEKKQRIEEEERKAKADKLKADEEQRILQEKKLRIEEEKQMVEEARRKAEAEQRRIEEERQRAEADRQSAQETKAQTQGEKMALETARKQIEEIRTNLNTEQTSVEKTKESLCRERQFLETERHRLNEDRKILDAEKRAFEQEKKSARETMALETRQAVSAIPPTDKNEAEIVMGMLERIVNQTRQLACYPELFKMRAGLIAEAKEYHALRNPSFEAIAEKTQAVEASLAKLHDLKNTAFPIMSTLLNIEERNKISFTVIRVTMESYGKNEDLSVLEKDCATLKEAMVKFKTLEETWNQLKDIRATTEQATLNRNDWLRGMNEAENYFASKLSQHAFGADTFALLGEEHQFLFDQDKAVPTSIDHFSKYIGQCADDLSALDKKRAEVASFLFPEPIQASLEKVEKLIESRKSTSAEPLAMPTIENPTFEITAGKEKWSLNLIQIRTLQIVTLWGEFYKVRGRTANALTGIFTALFPEMSGLDRAAIADELDKISEIVKGQNKYAPDKEARQGSDRPLIQWTSTLNRRMYLASDLGRKLFEALPPELVLTPDQREKLAQAKAKADEDFHKSRAEALQRLAEETKQKEESEDKKS